MESLRLATVRISLFTLFLGISLQGALVHAQWDEWVFTGTITQGLPGSPYLAGLAYRMSFMVPPSAALAPTGLYGQSGSAGFSVGTGSIGGSGVVFVVNDRIASGGRTFDGVIFSTFGGGAPWYFGADTPFDGTVDGITLVAESPEGAGRVFADTRLPASIDLNQFPERIASMHFGYPPTTQTILGTVDRLYINGNLVSVAVPEPSTYSLFAFSCTVLCIGAWGRSRTTVRPSFSRSKRTEHR